MEPSDKDRCTAQFPGATSRQSWLPGGDGNPERERERERRIGIQERVASRERRIGARERMIRPRRVASRRAAPRRAVPYRNGAVLDRIQPARERERGRDRQGLTRDSRRKDGEATTKAGWQCLTWIKEGGDETPRNKERTNVAREICGVYMCVCIERERIVVR